MFSANLLGVFNIFIFHQIEEVRTEDLKQFVRKHSGIYIGLAGCLQEFDEIANEFVRNLNTEAYEVAVAKGNQLMNGYDTEKVCKIGWSELGVCHIDFEKNHKHVG